MIRVKIDATGAKRKFNRAAKEFAPQTLMRAIGHSVLSWINRNFETSGGLVGGWKPLAASGRRGKPLQHTGKLRRSFRIIRQSGKSVTVGTTVSYAAAHQFGVPASKINPIVPRRAKALRFVMMGNIVFAKRVKHHPGIPRRRMLPNQKETREIAVNMFSLIVKRINQER